MTIFSDNNHNEQKIITKKNNNLINVYLDFDDTIAQSTKTVVEILNKKYNINPPKTEDDCTDWQYRSIVPELTAKDVDEIYASDEFFSNVTLDPVFEQYYEKHKNDFNWFIVTKGDAANLAAKGEWVANRFGDNVTYIPLSNKTAIPYDKSMVDMKDGIQIDDSMTCLRTNATIKILKKSRIYRVWNQPDTNVNNLYIAYNWKEITQILDTALRIPEILMKECY